MDHTLTLVALFLSVLPCSSLPARVRRSRTPGTGSLSSQCGTPSSFCTVFRPVPYHAVCFPARGVPLCARPADRPGCRTGRRWGAARPGSWSMPVPLSTGRTPASVTTSLVRDGGRRVTGTAAAKRRSRRLAAPATVVAPGPTVPALSARRRVLRPALSGEVGFPVVHEPPSPLEQVRAGVGRLDLVLDDVSQRCLDDLPRVVRLLGRPVPERRAAREARLPANAFRGVRRGQRPSIDRADELCRALGITMTIGTSASTRTDGTERNA